MFWLIGLVLALLICEFAAWWTNYRPPWQTYGVALVALTLWNGGVLTFLFS